MPPFEAALLDQPEAPNDSILSSCSPQRDFQEPSGKHLLSRRDSEDSSSSKVAASDPEPCTDQPTPSLSDSRPLADQDLTETTSTTVAKKRRNSSQSGTEQMPQPQSSKKRRSRFRFKQNPREKEIKLHQEMYYELLKKQNPTSEEPKPSFEQVLEILEERHPEELHETHEIPYAAGIELLVEFHRRWTQDRSPQGSGQDGRRENEPFGELNSESRYLECLMQQYYLDRQGQDVGVQQRQGQPRLKSQDKEVSRHNEAEQKQDDLSQAVKEENPILDKEVPRHGEAKQNQDYLRQEAKEEKRKEEEDGPIDLTLNQKGPEIVKPPSNVECLQQETLQQQQATNQNHEEKKPEEPLSIPSAPQQSDQEPQAERSETKDGQTVEATSKPEEDSENNTQVAPKKARTSRKSKQRASKEKAFAELLLRSQLQQQAFEQQKQAVSSILQQQLSGQCSPLTQQQATPLQNLMNMRIDSGLLPVCGQTPQTPLQPSPRYPQLEQLLRAPQQPLQSQRSPSQMTQEELQKRLPPQTSLRKVELQTPSSQDSTLHKQSELKSPQAPQQSPLMTQTQQSPQLPQVTDRSRLLQLLQQSPQLQFTPIQQTPLQMQQIQDKVVAKLLTTPSPNEPAQGGLESFAAPLDRSLQQQRKKRRSSKMQHQLNPDYLLIPHKQINAAQGTQGAQVVDTQKKILCETLRQLLLAAQASRPLN